MVMVMMMVVVVVMMMVSTGTRPRNQPRFYLVNEANARKNVGWCEEDRRIRRAF
jgi:hypothetical protein